jgi:decaprenyl-phosphate phosphoribosyltransferase
MHPIIKLIRPKEWIKNGFIFIPSFFAGDLFNLNELLRLALAAAAFSLVASGVYVLNDFNDRAVDRLHPKKKNRPLASGKVSESTAIALMVGLFVTGGLMAFFVEVSFFYMLLIYLGVNVLYSFGLKNVAILDLFIVASGFIIRIYGGGMVAHVPVSHWLSIMILLSALLLVIAKRRDDILITTETGGVVRKSSQTYNLEFINSCLTLLSAVIIVAYIMYTFSPEVTSRFKSDYLFSTTIFVIAGIMRYLQITFVEGNSGSPTSLLYKDKFIILTLIGWLITFYIIIYAT